MLFKYTMLFKYYMGIYYAIVSETFRYTMYRLMSKVVEVRIIHLKEEIDHDGILCITNLEELQKNITPEAKLPKTNHLREMLTDIFYEIQLAMHCVAVNEFGSKRVNFSLRSSYQTRCEDALISKNSGGFILKAIVTLITRDTKDSAKRTNETIWCTNNIRTAASSARYGYN
uniref:Uncharacterized protein n=1 Tax=Vespula pensylvanica TaxID=30213 RepID=A0A834KAB9_VESPE|nr:hypothetical protein H0235_015983 [Vespula pensylvanica]